MSKTLFIAFSTKAYTKSFLDSIIGNEYVWYQILEQAFKGEPPPTLLQLNAITLRACWGEEISLMLAQVQVLSQECPQLFVWKKKILVCFLSQVINLER